MDLHTFLLQVDSYDEKNLARSLSEACDSQTVSEEYGFQFSCSSSPQLMMAAATMTAAMYNNGDDEDHYWTPMRCGALTDLLDDYGRIDGTAE